MTATCRHFEVLSTLCVVLLGTIAVTHQVKIGLNLGTSSASTHYHPYGHQHQQEKPLHYCTTPQERLLKNLYVDYFHSSGPCMAPDGTRVQTFRTSGHSDGGSYTTRTSVCAKLPRICQLWGRQGGRGIMEAGQQMVESFRHNMRSLYHLLTRQSATPASTTSTPKPQSASDPRFYYSGHAETETIVSSSDDCSHSGCKGYGLTVCETVGDFAFPLVGQSALTNTTVIILQDFPDLVQPVFFRKCRTRHAQVVYGKCIQEYLPVSFLVSPPYPGAVLAQDFVMVESGCHVAADFSYPKWEKTHPRDVHDNITDVEENFIDTRVRGSDRRLF